MSKFFERKSIGNIINLVMVIVIFFTAILGSYALISYKQANRVSMISTLEELEGRVYDMLITDSEPYLIFYLYYEPIDSIEDTNKINIQNHANFLISNIIGHKFEKEWNTIPDLYSLIVELYLDTSNQNSLVDYCKLMKSFILSERLIFLSYKAFIAYRQGIINKDDWENFAVYFKDFNRNPIFLSAIDLNNELGYFNSAFAEEVKSRIGTGPFIKCLYPEILRADWSLQADKPRLQQN